MPDYDSLVQNVADMFDACAWDAEPMVVDLLGELLKRGLITERFSGDPCTSDFGTSVEVAFHE